MHSKKKQCHSPRKKAMSQPYSLVHAVFGFQKKKTNKKVNFFLIGRPSLIALFLCLQKAQTTFSG